MVGVGFMFSVFVVLPRKLIVNDYIIDTLILRPFQLE